VVNVPAALMFVPARQRTLDKVAALDLDADGYIFDLEDSVPPAEREAAADMLTAFLSASKRSDGQPWFVRINRQCPAARAVDIAVCANVDGVMIPKMDLSESSRALVEAVANGCRKKVMALVETPRGMLELEQIAGLKGVTSLAFGAEDLTCELGAENCRETLCHYRSRIVLCARANGLLAFDTPTFETKDAVAIRAHAEDSRRFGFDGKLVIHPAQIPVVRTCFAEADPAFMRHVVDEYERLGGGIQVIDGNPYEAMHINRLKRLLGRQGDNK